MTGRYYASGKSVLSSKSTLKLYYDYFYGRRAVVHVAPRRIRRRWRVLERKGYKGFPFVLTLNPSLTSEEQKELYQWAVSNVPGEIAITNVRAHDGVFFMSDPVEMRTCIRATTESALVMLKIKFG